jgi:hypothetical protein
MTKLLQTTKSEEQKIEVSVSYSLGGMNYFSGRQEPRGYYLHVSPIKIEQHEGYTSRSFTAFSGGKWLILEAKRKSPKQLAQAVELAKHKEDEAVKHILLKSGLTLALTPSQEMAMALNVGDIKAALDNKQMA